jgi:hypothetical protein
MYENSREKNKNNYESGRFQSNEIPKFEDNFFDIIYIDGKNHEPEYVLEDAVLSFRKLKTWYYDV